MTRITVCIFCIIFTGCHTTELNRRPFIDQLLHQTGARHGTFGPTGKRLFADRLEPGLGIRGQFNYIHHANIHDPIHLTLQENGRTLPQKIEHLDWYPSHVWTRSTIGRLSVSERKFITDDDTLMDQITLTNDSSEPVKYTLRLASGFADRLERRDSTFTTVDLTDAANADPFPGRDVFTGEGHEYFRAWYEAERAIIQKGAKDRDRRKAASGGEVLGQGFGENVDHFAIFEFATPALQSVYLYLRTARLSASGNQRAARWNVYLDGKPLQQVDIAPTGGWGDSDDTFRWVQIELGELSAGGHRLQLAPDENRAVTHFDGFYISDIPFVPPQTASEDRLAKDAIEQIAYRPARQDIDGIPFNLINPEKNNGRAVIVARDSSATIGPSNADEIIIPIPGGSADLIHFCGQIAGRLNNVNATIPIAEYELQFADGGTERVLLTSGDIIKPTWTGFNVLSHPLPRDRHLLNVVFRALSPLADAVLAAITLEHFPSAGPNYHLIGSDVFYDVRAQGVMASPGFEPRENESAMVRSIRLAPGESIQIPIALALGENISNAEHIAHGWQEDANALERHTAAYQKWFDDNCPRFDCDNPYITRLWWYRCFLMRHNLSRAIAGNLMYPCFFESMQGRDASMISAFSSPHIISEVRWLRDPEFAYGQVRGHVHTADEKNHYFLNGRTNSKGSPCSNWIGKAAWEAYWVNPNMDWLRDVIPTLAGDVLGVMHQFDRDQDMLLSPPNQFASGMPWQPSFFYTSNFDNTEPEDQLERSEFAAYVYGNAKAVSEIYELLEFPSEAKNFAEIAGRIRNACLTRQWNQRDHFIYPVREYNDEQIPVAEVAAFFPLMTGLIPNESRYMPMLGQLVDPAQFWTPYPPASVSKKCPAYTPTPQHWPAAGKRISRYMWNGPTWPHACSSILNVIATVLSDYNQSYVRPEHFWELFERYTHMQFEEQDLARPVTCTYYNAETGAPDGYPDVFSSTYCDLIIRYLAGVQPANSNQLTLRPLPGPIKRFSLRRLRYRGHELDIVYNQGGGGLGEQKGLTVSIDGRWAAHRSSLGELTVELPEDTTLALNRPAQKTEPRLR